MEYRRRNSAIRVRDESPPSGPPHLLAYHRTAPTRSPLSGTDFCAARVTTRSSSAGPAHTDPRQRHRVDAMHHPLRGQQTIGYGVASYGDTSWRPPTWLASRGPCGLVAGASPEPRGVCSQDERGPSRPRARGLGGSGRAYALVESLATPADLVWVLAIPGRPRKPPPRLWPA